MTLRYTSAASPLGPLFLVASRRGLVAVGWGEGVPVPPEARLERDDAGLRAWLEALLRHLEVGEAALDLPLDLRATPFQWRVWRALRAIPYGETRTYQEVAVAIGAPSAVRAVARACAANPVALVIPCHRVVRADGGLGGYRWGVERKRALLERERWWASRVR
ncbi:methylated-DNA--[protein]-cysteine S-methyltransferase [Marinithermus hydrothermalis]|uniref:Methylated-DNA--protein-cysteine methyltransferase n=1 Tax=Marinithermus hydrothermalis (strain DSM 14884 / JCM 11576 / T1) TaxID=869210 RepID=F2NLQ4_MARHT|nr:methylated-DNA--[protein]-cysteine S-methyltransferase [Marinithermus hydrothermalis]AEB10884.1 methylated-DNA/protein-cysteinemethyltransferase [Marinithermus hydrothermalis DSM 14884]